MSNKASFSSYVYVSPDGSDEAEGSLAQPLKSFDKALTLAAARGSEVRLLPGQYHQHLKLGARHSGITIRACEEGTATLSAGFTLAADAFESFRDGIFVCDLKRLGLGPHDIGPLFPIGAYGSERKYDGAAIGTNLALYCGSDRMKLASYPAQGFVKLKDVRDPGQCFEYPTHHVHPEYDSLRNPRGGEYVMDEETNARVKGWTHRDDLWVFGYFAYDWADSSSPVRVDTDTASIYPQYVSRYGAYEGALYRFDNVFDELKYPGQYYIDRKECKLYLIPTRPIGEAGITLCLDCEPLIDLDGANDVLIDGLTLSETRADALHLLGDGNILRNMTFTLIGGHAVSVKGNRNTVSGCTFNNIGRGGILLEGGDRKSLRAGGNAAVNNLIMNFGCVHPTYQAGVKLTGVGNICAHNEICYAPHAAILYGGNEHVIEYNFIHDVVRHSSDAGAIYAGRDWTAYGTVVRCNYIRDVGANGFTPDGIYFDDCLSGQIAYGNILVNVRKNGFLIGGGRDNEVHHNLLIGCRTGIKFDDRGRDAWVADGWAKNMVCERNALLWTRLAEAKAPEDARHKKYDAIAAMSDFDGDPDANAFPPNPYNNHVCENALFACEQALLIYKGAAQYSTTENNPSADEMPEESLKELSRKYALVDLDKIGRYRSRQETNE